MVNFIFCAVPDLSFKVTLKNSCNKKLLKVGVTEVGEIKMRAGKERTHSKSFPENTKFLKAFNIPAKISLEKTTVAN